MTFGSFGYVPNVVRSVGRISPVDAHWTSKFGREKRLSQLREESLGDLQSNVRSAKAVSTDWKRTYGFNCQLIDSHVRFSYSSLFI
jgi:hypothetical protein